MVCCKKKKQKQSDSDSDDADECVQCIEGEIHELKKDVCNLEKLAKRRSNEYIHSFYYWLKNLCLLYNGYRKDRTTETS